MSSTSHEPARRRGDTALYILEMAAAVLERDGPAGLTTRAVCEAAGVTAPTLYHHYRDKDGLARALIERAVSEFMARKRMDRRLDDPLQDLRRGWDVALAFALANPALYALVAEQSRSHPALLTDSYALLQGRVERLQDAGLLALPVDAATRLVWAASSGALSLVLAGRPRREVEQTGALLFEAVVARITASAQASGA